MAKSKAPSFQFYPTDWQADTAELSVAAKGAWIQCLCKLHLAKRRGKMRRSMPAWARLFGTTEAEADTLLREISDCDCADVTFGNTYVTVMSRRMERERKEREAARLRVATHRAKRKCNSAVQPSSSSSVSSVTPKKKEAAAPPSAFVSLRTLFETMWSEAHGSETYPFQGAKDGTALAQICDHIGGDVTKGREIFKRYFANREKFYAGHSLALLNSKLATFLVPQVLEGSSLGLANDGSIKDVEPTEAIYEIIRSMDNPDGTH